VVIENAFEIKNNFPIISNQCDNFDVDLNNKIIDLTRFESDIEDSEKDLIWNIDQTTINTNLFTMKILDSSEDKIEIIPMDNVSGSDDITLTLTDKDNGLSVKSNVTINVNSVISYYYNLNITVSPNWVEIVKGQSHNVTLTITNIGTLSDNYTIFFESNEFTEQDIQIEKEFISLISEESRNIDIIIDTTENTKTGTFKIKLRGKSNFASDDTTLTINIRSKDGSAKEKDNTIFFLGIFLIIIILIVLFLLFSKRRAKKKEIESQAVPFEDQTVQHPITQGSQTQFQESQPLPPQQHENSSDNYPPPSDSTQLSTPPPQTGTIPEVANQIEETPRHGDQPTTADIALETPLEELEPSLDNHEEVISDLPKDQQSLVGQTPAYDSYQELDENMDDIQSSIDQSNQTQLQQLAQSEETVFRPPQIPCPLCQNLIQQYTNPCPHCNGELQWD
jgi:hypothetical protein